jgi:hypothetical protein
MAPDVYAVVDCVNILKTPHSGVYVTANKGPEILLLVVARNTDSSDRRIELSLPSPVWIHSPNTLPYQRSTIAYGGMQAVSGLQYHSGLKLRV